MRRILLILFATAGALCAQSVTTSNPLLPDYKVNCRVATTAAVTIATALNAGDAIDGVTLAAGDRVLVKDQAAPAQNGIYVVSASPARASDSNTWAEQPGAFVAVTEGTANGDTIWLNTSAATGTIGATNITWTEAGGGSVDDTVYGAGWNGSLLAPTQNSVYDKIESLAGGGFDSTTIDAPTWSDGANATNIWSFDVSGTDTTLTWGNNNWVFGVGSVDLGAAGVRLSQDGDGALTLLGLGNGSDEDLTINLDDTANTWVVTTSTAVTTLDLSLASMTLHLGAAGVSFSEDGDGALTIKGRGDGSDEDLIFNLDDVANTVGVTSSTGVTQLNLGTIGIAAGATALAGHLTFTDNTYDIGASGATRPRDLFLADDAVIGGDLDVAGTTTAGTLNVTTANATSLIFEGASADDFETTLTVTDPTADRTWTLGNVSATITATDGATLTFQGTDTYVGRATTDTLTNKTLTSPTVTTPTVNAGAITLAENAYTLLDSVLSADGKFTGTAIPGTAGATLAFGDLIYLDPTDSRWELVDANAASGADGDARGIIGLCVLAAASDGDPTVILLQGTIRADTAFPSFTINAPILASETAGDVTNTSPTTEDNVVRVLGYGLTADSMYFNPASGYIIYDAP